LLRARIIEIIGHLSLAGAPLLGHWRGYRSSPALHHTLLRAIMMRRAVTPTTVDAMLKSRDSSDEPPADPLRLLSAPHESYYH
ncbi:MAG: UDP-3-O-acyl-N-acetylglucosamine deacetylase, partial [Pseudomonadota bacterium]